MNKPNIYLLFIGGAADKEPFVWQNIKLPFKKGLIHHSMGRLAKHFSEQLKNRLPDLIKNSPELNKTVKIDYLGYHELYFDELESPSNEDITQKIANSERYLKIKQNIGEQTKLYIVGHSLGGWNGAHLSRILTQLGCQVECLITLDPVGTGNHDISLIAPLIKKAQIYQDNPIPSAKFWINIRGHHIDLKRQVGSWLIEDWVAWAGGQWLIEQSYPSVHQQINELTDYPHKAVFKLFNHPTQWGVSANEFLIDLIVEELSQ